MVVFVSLCLTVSCVTLRTQTLADKHLPQVRLARSGDDRSLVTLMSRHETDLRLKTTAAVDGTLSVQSGTKCYILEEAHKRCQGLAVFTKVRVLEGPEKDVEGWVCGAFLSHRKVAAL